MNRISFLQKGAPFCVLMFCVVGWLQAQNTTVSYEVSGGRVLLVGCACPGTESQPALAMGNNTSSASDFNNSLTEDQYDQFNSLLMDFSGANKPKDQRHPSKAGNNVTVIKGPAKGPGNKLCDFIRSVIGS